MSQVSVGDLVALVDPCDVELVSQYAWHPARRRNSATGCEIIYAATQRGQVLMHRLILGSPTLVDHRDRNGLNNQRANLRAATRSQNAGNQAKRQGCSSQYKGVSWSRSNKGWRAKIMVRGTLTLLGTFRDEAEAARAYDAAAVAGFGEFALLNFPEDHR